MRNKEGQKEERIQKGEEGKEDKGKGGSRGGLFWIRRKGGERNRKGEGGESAPSTAGRQDVGIARTKPQQARRDCIIGFPMKSNE